MSRSSVFLKKVFGETHGKDKVVGESQPIEMIFMEDGTVYGIQGKLVLEADSESEALRRLADMAEGHVQVPENLLNCDPMENGYSQADFHIESCLEARRIPFSDEQDSHVSKSLREISTVRLIEVLISRLNMLFIYENIFSKKNTEIRHRLTLLGGMIRSELMRRDVRNSLDIPRLPEDTSSPPDPPIRLRRRKD